MFTLTMASNQALVEHALNAMKDAAIILHADHTDVYKIPRLMKAAGFTIRGGHFYYPYVKQYTHGPGVFRSIITFDHTDTVSRNLKRVTVRIVRSNHADGTPPKWEYTFTAKSHPRATVHEGGKVRALRRRERDPVFDALLHAWNVAFKGTSNERVPFTMTPLRARNTLQSLQALFNEHNALRKPTQKLFHVNNEEEQGPLRNANAPPPAKKQKHSASATRIPHLNFGALRAIAERDPRAAAMIAVTGKRGRNATGNISQFAKSSARAVGRRWRDQTKVDHLLTMMRDVVLLAHLNIHNNPQLHRQALKAAGFLYSRRDNDWYKGYGFKRGSTSEWLYTTTITRQGMVTLTLIKDDDDETETYTFSPDLPPVMRVNSRVVPNPDTPAFRAVTLAWHAAFGAFGAIKNVKPPAQLGVRVRRAHKLTPNDARDIVHTLPAQLARQNAVWQRAKSLFHG